MNEQRHQAIDLAVQWLTESGIVERDDQHPGYGGVYLGMTRPRGAYPKLHHRITGYGLSVFIMLHRRRSRGDDLELAYQAALYLMKHRSVNGHPIVYGACSHAYLPSELRAVESFLSFDNAVIIQGFCDLYRQAGSEDALDAAMEAGSWLVENMVRPEGGYYARVDLPRRKLGLASTSFDSDGGCLHAKHAIGLLRLHRLCGDERFLRAARDVLYWALGLQREDGLFWATEQHKYVYAHAHCYAAEGMLFGSVILEDERLFHSAVRAVDALLALQSTDGALPAITEEGRSIPWKALNMMLPFRATDATAQALRLWCLLYLLTKEDKYLQAAYRAERYLLSVQIPLEAGRKFAGAFHYQEAETSFGLHVRPTLYTWVTQFAVAGLYWLDDLEQHSAELQTFLRECF